jgi:hypothetical protein
MNTNVLANLLDRVLEPVSRCLTPDAATQLLALRADESAQIRMDELADKANEGTISNDERMEYEVFIAAANVIAILQAKARRIVGGGVER